MLFQHGFSVACILMLTVLLISCSGGGSPLAPGVTDGLTQSRAGTQNGNNSRVLWGYWNVVIDPASMDVEIVPLRNAMFNANVTMFMQPPAGSITNLKIDILDMSTYFDDGRIDVDVSLSHPFSGLVDYTGFDVFGIFINDGPATDSINSDLMYAYENVDAAILLNQDGFTRWFNYPEFTGGPPILGFTPGALGNIPDPTATINPYKYFADGLDSDFFHGRNTRWRTPFSDRWASPSLQ